MDDLDVLAPDFGLPARGKANPMRSAAAERRSTGDPLFSEVFGGQAKYTPSLNLYGNHKQSAGGDLDYDSIFQSTSGTGVKKSNDNEKSSSVPAYDKPMYDDDIFNGLPGVKSKSGGSTVRFDDDVFASISSTGKSQNKISNFDDLLGNFGREEKLGEENKSNSAKSNINSEGFDDLLAGFGNGSSNARNRSEPESRWRSVPDATSSQKTTVDDPFIVLESNSTPNSSSGRFTDPLEEIGKLNNSRSARVEAPSGGGAFDDLDPLGTVGKPAYSNSRGKENGVKKGDPIPATSRSAATEEPTDNSSFGYSKSNMKEALVDNFQEPPIFDVPNVSMDFQKSSGQSASSSQHYDTGTQTDTSPASEAHEREPDDAWLTVSEIPLFTQSSTAPPPSRPPPPIPRQASRTESRSYSSSFRKKGDEFSPRSSYVQHPQNSNQSQPEANSPPVTQFDDLEEFAMGRSQNSFNGSSNLHSSMESTAFSEAAASAAAMKDAMDKAEAKFRHAKEAREREQARAARNKEFGQVEKDDHEEHERELRESQVRLERERLQKEEEEREQRRLERERLREIESQKARQVVERSAREARERAAAEARERASTEVRLRAERAAVERANAEARLRAERAAVQRVQAEARERAGAEAKERAEKAAASEAREKELQEKAAASRTEAEAKRRAERAAVERAAAEARERAAAQARERVASAARKNQQTNDNDLESFFGMGRASSAPRASSNTTDPFFNQQFNSKGEYDAAKRAPYSSGAPSTMKKASSASNFVDDLSSIFGAAPSGEFQEVEGEPEERRKARLDRHQRTQERAAKALAEKNQRDLQTQREQQERHRVGETLDVEIKRWAAGKEGNLRALLSTLQYVLWPECGWQPVSLTDLITAASVKKVYRKATLCVHPDKVQQKGANLQQKYIAEKVFDLLKEAWNKFNSEELF